MGVDITIGERIPAKVAPLFPCGIRGCKDEACRRCVYEVREEVQSDAPTITVTCPDAQHHTGGFNFNRFSYGYYARWLDETHIAEQFPMLNYQDQPEVIAIPDGLGAALHKLASDIELGSITTKSRKNDAEFARWFAWWCDYAVRTYGDRAAILFH